MAGRDDHLIHDRGGEARRRNIVGAIETMTAENGYAPTIREISDVVGLRSPDSVVYHLLILRDAGRVTWKEGKSRTLRIVPGS